MPKVITLATNRAARAYGGALGYGQRFSEGHDSGRINKRVHIRFMRGE